MDPYLQMISNPFKAIGNGLKTAWNAINPFKKKESAPQNNPGNNPGTGFDTKNDVNATTNQMFSTPPQSTSNTYQPKYVPEYKKTINDFWNEGEARSIAQGEFNPYYDTKVSDINKEYDTTIKRTNEDYDYSKVVEESALDRFLEQTGLAGTRTKEDLRTAIDSLRAEKGETQATTAYDRVRQNRALMQELSAKGLQFGGMAAGAGREAAGGRKIMQDKVERMFTERESSANTATSRSLEDISAKEKDRKMQNVAELGRDSEYFNELVPENQRAAYGAGRLGTAKTRAVEDATLTKEEQIKQTNEDRKYKIEQAVNQRWQKAYDSWDMDMKQYLSKYGISV